jgi:hypothetical protein
MDATYLDPELPPDIKKKTFIGIIQRDERTSLFHKKLYVWIPFFLSILLFTIIGGMSSIRDKCQPCNDDQSNAFLYFSYITIIIAIIAFFMNLVLMIYPRWAWMTSTFYREKCIGFDREDCESFVLSKEGHQMAHKYNQDFMKLNKIIDTSQQHLRHLDETILPHE